MKPVLLIKVTLNFKKSHKKKEKITSFILIADTMSRDRGTR